MRTRVQFNSLKLPVFLLLMLVVLFASCKEELPEVEHEPFNGEVVHKHTITLEALNKRLAQHKVDAKLTRLLEVNTTRNPEDFIVKVDENEIAEFSEGEDNYYTLKALTDEEDGKSYTNILIHENPEYLSYHLLRYIPSDMYVSEKLSSQGEYVDFEGVIQILDPEGVVLGDGIVTNGNVEPRVGAVECSFTIIPIYEQCGCGGNADGHSPSGPPCCQGSQQIGSILEIDCPSGVNAGGGFINGPLGSGGNGGNGGNNNNGGGLGQTGYSNLPTDPAAWDLFMQLRNFMGSNDTFYFDDDINEDNAIVFDSFEDFENEVNGLEFNETNVSLESDGTYTSHLTFDTGVSTINVLVKQTLKTDTDEYEIHSISSFLSGFTLGKRWVIDLQSGVNIGPVNYTDNEVTINMYGNLTFDSFIEGWGVYFSKSVHLRMTLDILTGSSSQVHITYEP